MVVRIQPFRKHLNRKGRKTSFIVQNITINETFSISAVLLSNTDRKSLPDAKSVDDYQSVIYHSKGYNHSFGQTLCKPRAEEARLLCRGAANIRRRRKVSVIS